MEQELQEQEEQEDDLTLLVILSIGNKEDSVEFLPLLNQLRTVEVGVQLASFLRWERGRVTTG